MEAAGRRRRWGLFIPLLVLGRDPWSYLAKRTGHLLHFWLMAFRDSASQFFAKIKVGGTLAAAAKYYVVAISALIGFCVADLTILHVRPMMLPKEAPPLPPQKDAHSRSQSLADYNPILDRNIFNEDGLIPQALAEKDQDLLMKSRPAVPSQLPLQLLGTIVHYNPKFSIATVNVTSKSKASSYRNEEDIEGLAKVSKIERKRLTFLNLNNRRLEFIEIPEESTFAFSVQNLPVAQGPGEIIEKKGQYEFAIKRNDLESMLQNLGALLQQARMEPVFSPDGVGIEGFKFVSIQPGSAYEKFGFQVGDMIRTVNNEQVNSPQKAMEMFPLLRSSNFVQLGVERNGREEAFSYTIQ
jgi:general secretion pathway protein C